MALSEDATFPACPDCGTNLLVQRAYTDAEYVCRGCETEFEASAYTGVAR